MELLINILPLLAIVLLFWLLVIRPSQRRQKETAAMQAALEPGQEVMLTSGIFGTVVSLADDRARIALVDGTEAEVLRAAIGSIVRPEQAPGPDSPESSAPDA